MLQLLAPITSLNGVRGALNSGSRHGDELDVTPVADEFPVFLAKLSDLGPGLEGESGQPKSSQAKGAMFKVIMLLAPPNQCRSAPPKLIFVGG